jgi:hypothetical protein
MLCARAPILLGLEPQVLLDELLEQFVAFFMLFSLFV